VELPKPFMAKAGKQHFVLSQHVRFNRTGQESSEGGKPEKGSVPFEGSKGSRAEQQGGKGTSITVDSARNSRMSARSA